VLQVLDRAGLRGPARREVIEIVPAPTPLWFPLGTEGRRASCAAVICALTLLIAPPPATAQCAGDCSGDGQVTVDEVIIGVNIALGEMRVEQCMAIDANGDRQVTVEEIVGAVNAALEGCPLEGPRLVVLSREGRIAVLDVAAPWTVRKSGDLGAGIASARCHGGRCLVVHPAPADLISVVYVADLAVTTIRLERGADPRDVAIVDDDTAVVSQYGRAELLEIDLATQTTTAIDSSVLADEDGLPEASKLATCGRRVYAQLLRLDHDTQAPAPIGAALAVIDLDETERIIDVDPNTGGVQGIALADRPAFDMPVDCAAGMLYVAEPRPLMQGGGGYEQVDLSTLTASDLPIDTGAQVGGFEVVEPGLFWLITHTDFGPGASSHLNLVGGSSPDTYNTFAGEHVDDLALDGNADLLFFPDPCMRTPANQSCATGIHVFDAHTGALLMEGIDVGFAPIEVVVSR
jgi:hypothetical protein